LPHRVYCLDTETTGLAHDDRLIEVALIEVTPRWSTRLAYHTLLDPRRPIHWAARKTHGLGLEDLRGQPSFRHIADELWNHLQGSTLIIHNASFDLRFLQAEFARARFPSVITAVRSVHCTLKLARESVPTGRHTLSALADYFDIATGPQHRAVADAMLLARISRRLFRHAGVSPFQP